MRFSLLTCERWSGGWEMSPQVESRSGRKPLHPEPPSSCHRMRQSFPVASEVAQSPRPGSLETLLSKTSLALATRKAFTGYFWTLPAPSPAHTPDHSVPSHIHPDQLRAQPAAEKATPTHMHSSPKPSTCPCPVKGTLPHHTPSTIPSHPLGTFCLEIYPQKISTASASL